MGRSIGASTAPHSRGAAQEILHAGRDPLDARHPYCHTCPVPPDFGVQDLRSRLTETSGSFYMPGLTTLVRLIVDQAQRDRMAGLRTRSLVTGYPGSPLAGLDLQLARDRDLLEPLGVVHQPAAAEERAVTALMGSQMLDNFPHPDCDGVVGYWYGKGPGVDRSGDALRHGNFAGTSRLGAVVLLSGEDHEASSSTMPFQEEYAFASAGIPVLSPSSVAEFHALGLHAVAMSRYSGCWIALKLVTQLCDGGQTMAFDSFTAWPPNPDLSINGKPFQKRTDFTFFPGRNISTERELFQERHLAVQAYSRHHHLNRVIGAGDRDRLGIITSGKSYADLRQALARIGIDESELAASEVRILRMALTYPLDGTDIARFAAGLEMLIVVEEKRDFLESQVKAALHDHGIQIKVVGKFDTSGSSLFPVEGGFDADLIVERLGMLFETYLPASNARLRRAELAQIRNRVYQHVISRTPNYCSGCPHSVSTRLPEGHIAWGSPGCHSFATVIEQPSRHIEAMTQLGGEGLPWIGLAPFTERTHITQNVGDGSLWHSSYDNIRACVAAGVNITFKILYNGAVANTGAQSAPGARTISELTRLLELEGVSAISLITKEPRRYPRRSIGRKTTTHPPSEILDVQSRLADLPGVTVVIYDESCANERRRQRKRGSAPPADEFVFINERVCENCGDCGAKSNCMSLQKHPTVFGEKTQVHASSCNQDFSCLDGDCPSFVTVRVKRGTGYRTRNPPLIASDAIPQPHIPLLTSPYSIYAPGVGGTGVLTLNSILAVAASLSGLEAVTYDQTGAAQKWGPVLSTLTVAPAGVPLWSNKVDRGYTDVCLALDIAAASSPGNLDRYSNNRTATVVNTDLLPTGEMIRDIDVAVDAEGALNLLREYTDPEGFITLPARSIAEALFGDYLLTNIIVLGAAYQAGLLPLQSSHIEHAITLNGVSVERNKQAFTYGRLWVSNRSAVVGLLSPQAGSAPDAPVAAQSRNIEKLLDWLNKEGASFDSDSQDLLEVRLRDLLDYQNLRYAERYLDLVMATAERERELGISTPVLSRAVIKGFHRLMAYKDEYEVARLYGKTGWRTQLAETFDAPVRLSYRLHPPLLRAMGVDHKLKLGPWFNVPLAVLRRVKWLRGKPWDPFGHSKVRREERALISWYEELMRRALECLTTGNHEYAVQLANLPEGIRGYEGVKLANARSARAEAERLMSNIRSPRIPLGIG